MIIRPAQAVPRSIEELLPASLSAKLDRLDVLSRKMFAGKLPGERRSKRRGRSVEFDDFRNYSAGDDLRHIDWNVYARLDRLFIKLFREEEDLALHVVVDASASMQTGPGGAGGGAGVSKLVYAHRLAMGLAYVGLVNQNRVVAASFGAGGGVRQLAAVRGRSSVQRVAGFLLESLRGAAMGPLSGSGGDIGLAEALRQSAMHRSGRGVMVVLSDFLEPGGIRGLDPAMNALAAAGSTAFDTYLLQVLSPAELDPTKEAEFGLIGDLRLTDVETQRTSEVTVSSSLVAGYRRRLEAYTGELQRMAASRGMSCRLIPTDTPVETVLLDSLRRGGMLR